MFMQVGAVQARQNIKMALCDTLMNSLRQFPLGAVFPESPHAVACSLPTMADVCGYEEKDARVLNALKSGYPRFVLHPYVGELVAHYLRSYDLLNHRGLLVRGAHFAQAIVSEYAGKVGLIEVEPALYLVHFPEAAIDLAKQVRAYVQHVGCGLSSRQAEASLLRLNYLEQAYEEPAHEEPAAAQVIQHLSELCACEPACIRLCASGMSAFYAAFSAVRNIQRSRGRRRWLQLGWLYLDTGCILKEFLSPEESLTICYDLSDVATQLQEIADCGDELAAVVVEFPTNPLIQVADLAQISQVVHAQGGLLIVDPSIASVYNVAVFPFADLLVTSLTKFAAFEGDVMIGALAVNPDSPLSEPLLSAVDDYCLEPYAGDTARLAYQMQSAPAIVAAMNANAKRLADFLRRHPAIKRVLFAADQPAYAPLSKRPEACGAMITIELNGAMPPVYDALACLKGPSFGTQFTLVSAFMYLAHYDLVTSDSGRAFLQQRGICPELLRISVGIEPYAAIESVFKNALDASLSTMNGS
jgi:cystathionine gamma-synthase